MHPQTAPKTPADVRRSNRYTVLSLLSQRGYLAKNEIAQLTQLTNTTISTILDDLIDQGLVRVVDEPHGLRSLEVARGRPAALYTLDEERWAVAGLQITSDTAKAVLMRLDGRLLDSGWIDAPSQMPPAQVLDQAASLLESVMARSNMPVECILGLGVALEGVVDTAAGTSLWMLTRTGWSDVSVKEYYQNRLGLPTLVDYRVHAAALAESYFGSARGVSDFAYMNVDSGVAVSVYASGALMRSSTDPAGITGGLGHVLNTGGNRLCYCGNYGCVQTEITIGALISQLNDLLRVAHGHTKGIYWNTHPILFDNLIEAARLGDPLALLLRSRFARNLGQAVRSAALLFSANMIVLGGQAMQFGGEEALDSARRQVQSLRMLHPAFASTQVVTSSLEPDSATVGAGALVIQAVMEGSVAASEVSN